MALSMKNVLAMLAAAALLVSASAVSCPPVSSGDIPGACASKDASTVCGPSCVDALFKVLQSKVGVVPCDTDLSGCVSSLTSPFVQAGGNVQALLSCDKGAIAARVAPNVQCTGTKPTAAQIQGQLGAVGR